MDLRWLELFCRVYELKRFSQAGKPSLLSQPTVSEHIRYLEDLLEVRLFDRFGREIAPTRAGEILKKRSRSPLGQALVDFLADNQNQWIQNGKQI